MTAQADRSVSVITAIRDQFALLSILVLFAGFVSTDTYYSSFGLRYQLLNLSLQHLVYRGLTALVDNWLLLVSYLVAIVWLAIGPTLALKRWPSGQNWLASATYCIVAVVIAIAYFAGIGAGQNAAMSDLSPSASSLPTVQALRGTEGIELPFAGYRLLLADKDRVAVFKAVSDPAQVPFVHILRADSVSEIVITH